MINFKKKKNNREPYLTINQKNKFIFFNYFRKVCIN